MCEVVDPGVSALVGVLMIAERDGRTSVGMVRDEMLKIAPVGFCGQYLQVHDMPWGEPTRRKCRS